jgi:asparagine synthase (glutamine-hydrolysing)
MCGILLTVGGSRSFTHRDLSPLRKRGPDGLGFWTNSVVSMAQTRLSVLGLDERSQPPLENDRFVIVFNGEIYNFLTLAREITGKPAPSDTQVLLDAWTVMGPKVLPLLDGFFAFAIYDKTEKSVTLVRDQFGIKPLYYSMQHGALVASSVLQPLLDCLPERPSLNYQAMSEWAKYQLTFGPATFHRGVVRLPPGQMVTYDVYARTLGPRVTYEDIWAKRGDVRVSQTWVDDTRQILAKCVDAAATSDRPVTSTCSGGLDSSLVTRMLQPEVAYHANFTDPDVNETQWAKAAVEGIDTRLMVVNAREEFNLVERLDQIVEDFDELSVGSVILPLDDLYAQITRRYKVMLLGTGGDELFGGYPRYDMALGIAPQPAYQAAFNKLPTDTSVWERWRLLHVKGNPSLFKFFTEPTFPEPEEDSEWNRHAMLTFDRRHFLPGLLGIDDKMAGRYGLEGRPPLLHQKFVRRVLELEPNQMVDKTVLRAIAVGVLPEAVRTRPDKLGFSVPIGPITDRNAATVREAISSSPFRDLYNVKRLSFTSESKWDRKIFGLIQLDCWLRRYG